MKMVPTNPLFSSSFCHLCSNLKSACCVKCARLKLQKNLFRFLLICSLKGPFSGLRQFPIIESPLKMIKNTFYFVLKALFVHEIFKLLSWLFGFVEKRLDKKPMINFKIHDVTDWTANNYNPRIAQYLKK